MNKEDNLIHSAIEEADDLFMQILNDYPQLDDDDHRQDTFLLCLMTNCISRLHVLGWSERELVNEVFDWCKKAREWQDEHGNNE
jgi:hypothetical protein